MSIYSDEITDIDVFNKVRDHLMSQGELCLNFNGDNGYFGVKSSDYQKVVDRASEMCEEYGEPEHWEIIEEMYHLINTNKIERAMCAIGCLIKPEFYSEDLENQTVIEDNVLNAVKQSLPNWEITNSRLGMLTALQSIHDNTPIKNWETYFNILSNNFVDGTWRNIDLVLGLHQFVENYANRLGDRN